MCEAYLHTLDELARLDTNVPEWASNNRRRFVDHIAELRRKLNGLREPVELVNEAGELLGIINGSNGSYPDKNWEPPIGPDDFPPFGNQRMYSPEEVREALR